MKRIFSRAVALVAGCCLSLAPTIALAETRSVEHTIRSGDNLHLIAGYYYGNPREWKRIWRLNRTTLVRPDRLVPGRVVLIEGSSGGHWLGSYEEYISRVRGK